MNYFTYKLKLQHYLLRNTTHYSSLEIIITNSLNKNFIPLLHLEQLETKVMTLINQNLKKLNKNYIIENKDKSTIVFQFVLIACDEPRDIIISKPYFCPKNKEDFVNQWRLIINQIIEEYSVIGLKEIRLNLLHLY